MIKLIRLTWFLILLSSITVSFSIGVYNDNGEFTYYINNDNPIIKFNISSPAEPIVVDKVTVTKNDVDSYKNIIENDRVLNPSDGFREYNFLWNEFFNLSIKREDNILVKLFAYGPDGKEIIPKGDPIKFKLILDQVKPNLIHPLDTTKNLYLSINNNNLDISFSEEIYKYNIYINGNLVDTKEFNYNFLSDYNSNFNLEFSENELNEGTNSFKIEFWDLAGNKNEFSSTINYRGEDLTLTLLTRRDDSSLKYNFNSNYLDLFENNIYTEEEDFTLKVKTSKKANCYYSSILKEFDYYTDLTFDSYKLMKTEDNLIHSIDINVVDDSKIWIFCRNVVYDDDFAYLSNSLGLDTTLMNIVLYKQNPININRVLPNTQVTSVPFNFSVDTNVKGVCEFGRSGTIKERMNTLNFLYHYVAINSIESGNYNFEFTCIDVLNNKDSKLINLEVDENSGVQILSYSPEYTDKNSIRLKIGLSEDALCRYSLEDIPLQNSLDLTEIPGTGTGLSREFDLSPLVEGENKVYFYCEKGVSIFKRDISIIYDPNPPSISNFTFLNNGIESSYIASEDKLEFKFNVDSFIPVEKYYLEVKKDNYSINKEFSSNHPVINIDLKNASKISIIPENIIGKNGSLFEKELKFDLEPPVISFNFNLDEIKINCFDISGSGCNRIYYSLSKTSVCDASILYEDNSTIKGLDNNYICAKAFDNVGHSSSKLEPILYGSFNLLNDNNSNQIYNLTYNETDSNQDNESLNDGNYLDEDPWAETNYNETKTNDSNYLLISALFILFASMGGGGYYAYKKGYLNNELRKLGFKIPENSSKVGASNKLISKSSFGKNNISSSKLGSRLNSKSKYDHHLNKLNSFIDKEISRGSDLFDKFKNKKTIAEEKLGTTLTKSKQAYSDLSKDEFDEIYTSSKESKLGDKELDLKKEAENFEEFYKKSKKKNLNNETGKKTQKVKKK